MNNDDTFEPLDPMAIKELIAKIRKGQVWKKDIAKGRHPTVESTIEMWIDHNGIKPGPFKTKASIVHRNYEAFCKSKKITEESIITLNKFGEIVTRERLFPRYVAKSREVFYHINKDIHTDADREKQKIKKQKKKDWTKKHLMGTKTPNLQ